MEGVDEALVVAAVRGSRHAVIASGGVGSPQDLRRLARAGAAAAVVGMALYTGRLEPSLLREGIGA
jgi:phosphoribosylformimino-5-aminoimidazole carboxamide ribotide isomerase